MASANKIVATTGENILTASAATTEKPLETAVYVTASNVNDVSTSLVPIVATQEEHFQTAVNTATTSVGDASVSIATTTEENDATAVNTASSDVEGESASAVRNANANKKKGNKTWTRIDIEIPPHRPFNRQNRHGKVKREAGLPQQKQEAATSALTVPAVQRGRGGYRGRGKGRGKPKTTYEAVIHEKVQHYTYPVFTFRQMHITLPEQLDYYLSDENLIKDFFTRRNLDLNGYIKLDVLAGYHRVQQMTAGYHDVMDYLTQAIQYTKLELSADGTAVRHKEDPTKWVLPSGAASVSRLRADAPEFVFKSNVPSQACKSGVIDDSPTDNQNS